MKRALMAKNYISILAMSNINDTIPIYKDDPEKKGLRYIMKRVLTCISF